MKLSNELKAGLVVLVAIVLLVGMLIQTGDLSFGKKGYTVLTRLGFAAGVKNHAPVRLAGLEVGEIRDLRMIYNPEETVVEAVLWIEDGVKLRRDSLAIVGTLGLMGEKYIEIKPGAAQEFLGPGETMVSKDPIGMDELMEIFKDVGVELEGTLVDIRRFVNNTNEVVGGNKEKIGRIVDNIEEASAYVVDFTHDIKSHPWKVLSKGKEKSTDEMAKMRAEWQARRKVEYNSEDEKDAKE